MVCISIDSRMHIQERTCLMPVVFPHANGYTLADADFVYAWALHFQTYDPAKSDPCLDTMPRHNVAQGIQWLIARNRQFSLDYLCRTLVPNGYRNTMQATPVFMNANKHLLLGVPHGKVNGAKLLNDPNLCDDIRHSTGNHPAIDAILEADSDELNTPGNPGTDDGIKSQAAPAPAASLCQSLITKLVKDIEKDPFQPKFRKKPVGALISGWMPRYLAYFWPNPSIGPAATMIALGPMLKVAQRLTQAMAKGPWTPSEEESAVTWANSVFIWGGVPQKSASVTPDAIRNVFEAAISGTVPKNTPMNSGWTKVAAFASSHLADAAGKQAEVIWDSRVANSLISRLDDILIQMGHRVVPSCLSGIGTVVGRGGSRTGRTYKLAWPVGYGKWTAQFAGSELVAQIRDELHKQAIAGPVNGKWTIRSVEMVLFMDGY